MGHGNIQNGADAQLLSRGNSSLDYDGIGENENAVGQGAIAGTLCH
jgi:hypothetical protein